MEIQETSASGTTSFVFRHNPTYQQVQRQFWTAVDSLNPENVMELVRRHPYHVDSLIQVRYREEGQGKGIFGYED